MRKLLLASALLLSSCVDFPNQFASSRPRQPDTGPDPRKLKAFIEMKDASAAAHFAWGVNPNAFDGEKRMAGPRAALRFNVTETAGNRLSIDYVSAQEQTVRVKVNGLTIASFASQTPGHFEAPVEASQFVANTATLVEIESDTGLGLVRAGFLRK